MDALFFIIYEVFYYKQRDKNKKSYSRFLFSDLRAGWTKRAGDVTVEIFEKKVDQTLYKINTYHSPHVNHAWK